MLAQDLVDPGCFFLGQGWIEIDPVIKEICGLPDALGLEAAEFFFPGAAK